MQHQFQIYLHDFEGLDSLATVDSKETKPCLGLMSTAQGSGSSLKNYGLNQLKKVLRRPSEPAGLIGDLRTTGASRKVPTTEKVSRGTERYIAREFAEMILCIPERAMKLTLATALALLLFSGRLQVTAANDDTGWSSPVNGLQARLSLPGQAFNGTPLIATYLELGNVASVANVMEVPFNPEAIQFEVVDDQDKLWPRPSPYDELVVEVGMLRLPHDSYLRFDISHHGAGVPKNQTALLDLGLFHIWVFSPGDKRSFYLRGRFSVGPRKERTWSGMIEMPKVKIPIAE